MATAVRRQRGFALLMVLWMLMLLAFIATVFDYNARTEVLLARNLVANARAEALADGGVYRAAAGLTRAPRDGGFRGDGQVYIWRPAADADGTGEMAEAGGDEVRFTIRDEGGKVDLNQAPAALLRELFVAVGVDVKPSAALADAIVDFRDEDQEKQGQGAEAREYKQARLPWGPKNKPFVLVDELIYVLGMTPDLYRRVAPLVTVWGQGETPHPYTAPPEVLEALTAALKAPRGRVTADKSATSDRTKATDESRLGSGSSFGKGGLGAGGSSERSAFSGSAFNSPSSSSMSSGLSQFGSQSGFGQDTAETETDLEQQERSGGTTFTVHVEGRTADGTVFVREATIDITGTETAPLSIRSWRQGERTLFPANESAGG